MTDAADDIALIEYSDRLSARPSLNRPGFPGG